MATWLKLGKNRINLENVAAIEETTTGVVIYYVDRDQHSLGSSWAERLLQYIDRRADIPGEVILTEEGEELPPSDSGELLEQK